MCLCAVRILRLTNHSLLSDVDTCILRANALAILKRIIMRSVGAHNQWLMWWQQRSRQRGALALSEKYEASSKKFHQLEWIFKEF